MKTSDREGQKEAFEESLKALQTDYVDLYLIHWPATGYEQAWKEMIEIYKAEEHGQLV